MTDDFRVLRESQGVDVTYITLQHVPTGVTMKSCGHNRDEVIERLKAEIMAVVDILNEWPDEDAIADALNGEFDESEVVAI